MEDLLEQGSYEYPRRGRESFVGTDGRRRWVYPKYTVSGEALFVPRCPKPWQDIQPVRHEQNSAFGIDRIAIRGPREFLNECRAKYLRVRSNLVHIAWDAWQFEISFQHEFFLREKSFAPQILEVLRRLFDHGFFKIPLTFVNKDNVRRELLWYGKQRPITVEDGWKVVLGITRFYSAEVFADIPVPPQNVLLSLLAKNESSSGKAMLLYPPNLTFDQDTDLKTLGATLYSTDSQYKKSSRLGAQRSSAVLYNKKECQWMRDRWEDLIHDELPYRLEFRLEGNNLGSHSIWSILNHNEMGIIALLDKDLRYLMEPGKLNWELLMGLPGVPPELRNLWAKGWVKKRIFTKEEKQGRGIEAQKKEIS